MFSHKHLPRPLPPSRRARRSTTILCRPRRTLHLRRTPLAPRHNLDTPPTKPAIRFRVPRFLQRPPTREVNMAPILAAYPELSGVPPEYIREHLPPKGSDMLDVVASPNARAPKDRLPTQLEVLIDESADGIVPTHLLAVHSSTPSSSNSNRKVTLYPANQLVLATHCANFPIVSTHPPHSHTFDNPTSTTTTLPVVPLCLPSADTFPILHSYLCTKRVDTLRDSLAPVDANPWNTMAALGVILGVWRNTCALSIVDDVLWDSIDAAWGSVVGAMTGSV